MISGQPAEVMEQLLQTAGHPKATYRVDRAPQESAPGQFWTEYRFTRDLIVLDENLEISVPSGRAVKIKSATVQSVADGYRIYTWRHTNPLHGRGL